MLGEHPIDVVLLAPDLESSKDFYANKEDVRGEVAELRRRGVKIEEYDMPGLKTVDGIADIGFGLIAWFIDPGKNCVGMIQIK